VDELDNKNQGNTLENKTQPKLGEKNTPNNGQPNEQIRVQGDNLGKVSPITERGQDAQDDDEEDDIEPLPEGVDPFGNGLPYTLSPRLRLSKDTVRAFKKYDRYSPAPQEAEFWNYEDKEYLEDGRF